MIIRFSFVFSLLFVFSTNAQDSAPTSLFLRVQERLQDAYSLTYDVETKYHYRGEDKVMHTHFKQRRLSYDPYAGYSFYKEIDNDIKIYYHFLNLGIIEESKNLLSVFDYANDPIFPRHVSTYSNDLDNLWQLANIMERNKNSFFYVTSANINGKKYHKYRVQNYFLWIDVDAVLPFKLESLTRTGSALIRSYHNIQFNKNIATSTFTYPKDDGYVLVHRDPNPKPLVGSQAAEWVLTDVRGLQRRLTEFKGKPTFIKVWSAECSYCIASIPTVKEIYQNYGQAIQVVTVNMDYDLKLAKEAIKQHQMPFMVLMGDASFYRDYFIRSFPSYFVLDKEGRILLHETGAIQNQAKARLYQVLDKVSKE